MMKRWISAVLALACVLCLLCGCEQIGKVADDILEAAAKELLNKVKTAVEEYGVEVVELKSEKGQINDDGGEKQFFCAVLIRTNSEKSAEDCAGAMAKLFGKAGQMKQTDSKVESEFLENKSITYSHTDFSGDNYYTVYVYVEDIAKLINLDELAQKLKK